MKVAVIGAGGIGSLFGGRLAVAGHEVWLIHRRQEHVDAIRAHGLQLDAEQITIQATLDPHEVGPVDVVLVLTKSMDTVAAANSARALVDDRTLVVTLQNGLGNLEILADAVGSERVLMGMTYAGASLDAPGQARHTAPGETFVGEPNGRVTQRVTELASMLTAADLPTQATDQLWSLVWGKLIINAALNATCALTGAGGDDILASPSAKQLVCLVADEAAAIAARLGVSLPYDDPGPRVWRHCQAVGPAKPSMLQDIERRRPTEVDAINGAIVREGVRLGLPTPYNQALLLLIKGREDVARFL